MKREQLEHILRAAASITNDDELIVIGSQSVLGQFPDAPAELCVSNEADVYPKNHPERWDLIDGAIGELSPFHETYGYYAQGVEEGTATLPAEWQTRLIPIQTPATRGATGLCLEIHDLAVAKYVANREKDRRFLHAAIRYGLLDKSVLLARIAKTLLPQERKAQLSAIVELDFRAHYPQ